MRIAIPVTDGRIANHPGHCETFLVCDVKDGQVSSEVELPNPGHGPGGPPPLFLAREHVSALLAWGLPAPARSKFAALGITVHLGATGEPRQALRQHLAGTLVATSEGLDGGGGCGDEHEHGH
jgi:predicted Fe-Mo cluster-binding NifX family protein